MSETNYRKIAHDPDNSIICSRRACDGQAKHTLWITIRGHEYCKRFCDKHCIEEYDAEQAYKVGL